MKKLGLILFLFLFPSLLWAQSKEDQKKALYEAATSCDQGQFVNDDYVVSSSYNGVKGFVTVKSVQKQGLNFSVEAPRRVVDVKIQGNSLYVLTAATLQSWDLNTQKQNWIYVTHPSMSLSTHWRAYASGFILKGDLAIISHGVYGVSVLNTKNGRFEKQLSMPTISAAQDISYVNESLAVLAIDNDDEAQFRGLYLMDLNSLEFVRQIKVDNAFPSAVRVLDGNRLMMVFFNAVWKFDLNSTLKSSSASPLRRAWKFPGVFSVDMVGKVAFDNKYLYACMNLLNPETGEKTKKPMAFDLATLKLN